MSIELITILMFGCFFALLALGIPLAWNMGAIGIVFALIIGGFDFLPIALYRLWTVSANFGCGRAPRSALAARGAASGRWPGQEHDVGAEAVSLDQRAQARNPRHLLQGRAHHNHEQTFEVFGAQGPR